LVDPDLVDLASTIAEALAQRPARLTDVSRDVDADRLQRLADEVGRIARTLASLSASAPLSENGVSDMRPGFVQEPDMADNAHVAREIRAMLRMRRLRDRFFDSSLFADPAWDMLLDLMAARLERVQVAVSSLCIAACVPPTTALRWIKMMTESGLFERVSDPVDGRRVYIRLSDEAVASMTRLLATIRASGAQLV
jgi:DNA-binding MarR family transcriptional regulator